MREILIKTWQTSCWVYGNVKSSSAAFPPIRNLYAYNMFPYRIKPVQMKWRERIRSIPQRQCLYLPTQWKLGQKLYDIIRLNFNIFIVFYSWTSGPINNPLPLPPPQTLPNILTKIVTGWLFRFSSQWIHLIAEGAFWSSTGTFYVIPPDSLY